MYSDSDFDAYDEYDVAESSDDVNAMDDLEMQIQERDKILTTQAQSYAWIFEAEDGFFHSHFASLLASQQKHKDWWNSPSSPDCYHAVTALLNAEKGEGAVPAVNGNGHSDAKRVKTEGDSAPPMAEVPHHHQPTEAAAKASAVGLQPSGVYILSSSEGKPSPASRFLCDHFSRCILVPVDKTLNRANLRAAHKDVFASFAGLGEDGLDIVPGYKHTEASGWALPLSTDADVLAKMKALYPAWRSPTAADVRLFTKPESSGGRGGAAAANGTSAVPSSRSWTRNAAKLMSSKERFLTCVKEAGGWENVVFVAMDVEAFTVTANSVPLPAEFAFVPVKPPRQRRTAQHTSEVKNGNASNGHHDQPQLSTKDEEPGADTQSHLRPVKALHFFCHPGHIAEEEEITILYNCLQTHLIPYRDVTFLTHDYRSTARQVQARYVSNPRVVLINKGAANSPTLMDLQAIRWLYAAALLQEHGFVDVDAVMASLRDGSRAIPTAEDIHIFDVSVLEEAAAGCSEVLRAQDGHDDDASLKVAGEEEASNEKVSKRRRPSKKPACCWYHAAVAESDLDVEHVHCAVRDAEVLAQRVRDALAKWQPRDAV